ncbi:MAG: DNA polymerase III subunit [Candidatus Omnitrophica bacterium]|nr:DNA polymerase III subunit [Candidatus Omnitrophota bacterium]
MSFSQIKGQDKAISMLQGYLEEGRLEGGYLFSGPEGVGKKLTAITVAKAVNCENLVLDACDGCASCLKIEKGQYPDVSITDSNTPIREDYDKERADSKAIRIGHIRQLQQSASLRPYEGRRKVFIIDGAHALTAEASNAFLKILEEPPKDTLFLLITHKPGRVFKTITSRCKQIKFFLMARDELELILKEEYNLEHHKAHFLAYFCDGRLGCALKFKDRDILKEKNSIIDRWGLLHRSKIDGFALQGRDQMRDLLNILSSWFRDIYLLKLDFLSAEIINSDRKQDLFKIAPHFTFTELNGIFDFISSALLYVDENINIKLLLRNLEARLWKV